MKHIWTLLIATILLLGFSQPTLSQEAEGQLTIKEIQETNLLLATFEQRLEETNDIEQALQAVGAKDWFENTLRRARKSQATDLSIMGIQHELLINHADEYRRAWIAILNFTHLLMLNMPNPDDVDEEEEAYIKWLPREVLDTLRNNLYWAAYLSELIGETKEDGPLAITTLSELRDASVTAERAAHLWRTHLQELDAKSKQAMQQRLAKYKKEMGSEPHLHICNEKCASLPDGTRTAVMDYLLFQLTFAKIGDEMKLVSITSRIGE